MAEPGVERKLVAIVAADVVGYSRLMEIDEAATHAAYMAHLKELLEPRAGEYRGRIVKSTGDGFIAEFASVADAVEYVAGVQREMAARNRDIPDERRLDFRMGVNLGDVIVADGDIYGDGVNVAARLEGLAEPGGICVSGGVRDQVRNKVAFGFEDLGPQKVKNIAEPIRAYRLAGAGQGEAARPPRPSIVRRRKRAMAVAAATMAVIVAPLGGWRFYLGSNPATEKPSIAVLAFDNMGGDPKQEYFSDGITEDIITDLSKMSGLFVVARNASFTYKGRPVKAQTVGRELGVKYLLEGSVRKAGGIVRINAQLIDTETGGHLWAERYDRPVKDVFRVQGEISRKIAMALAVKLSPGERQQLAEEQTSNIAAYDAFLKGWAHYRRRTPEEFARAVRQFKRAVKLDPSYGRAHAALAATYLNSRTHRWTDRLGLSSVVDAMVLVRKHLKLAAAKPTPLAYRVRAQMAYREGRFAEAVAAARNAVALNPNDAESLARLGITLVWAGSAEKAVAPLQEAMRLDPRYPAGYLSRLGVARFATGKFEAAAGLLERAFKRNPRNHLPLVHLVAAYGQLGQTGKARATLVALNRLRAEAGLSPYFTSLARRLMPYKDPADLDRLIEGLNKAGLP